MELPRLMVNGSVYQALSIGPLALWFSYGQLIAFAAPGMGKMVSENCWSVTTGKHLNEVDGGNKKTRLPRDEFLRLWQELQMSLHHPLIDKAIEEGRCQPE